MITIKATASKKINVWPLFQRAAAGGINETGAEIVTLAAKGSPFEYGVLRGSWVLYQLSKIQGKSITPCPAGQPGCCLRVGSGAGRQGAGSASQANIPQGEQSLREGAYERLRRGELDVQERVGGCRS